MFRNKKHEIHMVEVNKVTLSRDDDKQIVEKDWISTLHTYIHTYICSKHFSELGLFLYYH